MKVSFSKRLAFTFVENEILIIIQLPESVVLLPPHGIQLETHRGPFPSQPFFSTKRFIPASNLSGVAINEALRGWNVLFYLIAVRHTERRGTLLEVAYEVNHLFIRSSTISSNRKARISFPFSPFCFRFSKAYMS